MTLDTIAARPDALGQFRALVMANEALAQSLADTGHPDRFVELAISSAKAHGITLGADAVRAQSRPDPLGLARWSAVPVTGSAWPPRHWLPIQVTMPGRQAFVDWAYFGSAPLTDPFFEESIRRALSRPFNRLFRYRLTLDDFVDAFAAGSGGADILPPSGFIFHMSRCGSTLVSQMLAALPHHMAISEAAPIDAMVQLSRAWPDLSLDKQAILLAAMVSAFGRKRSGDERRYFIKLDSWHALALPLFRRAFPTVPWLFLYRDPVEVMVSQTRQRGAQMVPEIVPPNLYGIDAFDFANLEDYCARVLGKICQAAADQAGAGGGLLVNYRDLPGAMAIRILPHFGVACSEAEYTSMAAAARYDAKAPQFAFADDAQAKQQEATAGLRGIADRHLADIYRRLEVLAG